MMLAASGRLFRHPYHVRLERAQAQVDLGTAATRDVDQARSDRLQAQAEFTRALGHLRALGISAEHRPRLLPVTSLVNGSVTALSARSRKRT